VLTLCLFSIKPKAETIKLYVDNDLHEAYIGVAVQGCTSFVKHRGFNNHRKHGIKISRKIPLKPMG